MATAKCLFCGRGNLTKEHTWPRWLRRLFPTDPMTHTYGPEGVVRAQWQAPPMTHTARVVCSICNGSWMSKLEVRARRPLSPMVRGNATALTSAGQSTVAAWAVKTAMMLQATHADVEAIDRAHFHELMIRGKAPAQTRVWLGRYRVFTLPAYFNQALTFLDTGPSGHRFRAGAPNGYIVSLILGYVVIEIFGTNEPNIFVPFDFTGSPLAIKLLRIWPTASSPVNWPPPILDDKEIAALVRILSKP